MPTSGTATYAGYAAYGAPGDTVYYVQSNADLTANFGSSTIAGSLTNFRTFDSIGQDVIFVGSVDVNNGVITGGNFTADLEGELAGAFDNTTVSDAVVGSVVGSFSGTDAGFAEGNIYAVIDGTNIVGYLYSQRQ